MNDSEYKIIENTKEIEKINDRFTLMLDRLEEKMDDLNKNMNKGFTELNGKITNLEIKFDGLKTKMNESEKQLPTTVNEIVSTSIENNKKDEVFKIVKWILVSVLGSTTIYCVGRIAWLIISKTLGV